MRIYIAGPMTGLPELNYPAFDSAEVELKRAGYDPINPARREAREDWEWIDYMRPALVDISTCDGIAALPYWHNSQGARLEVHIAASIGLPVKSLDEWVRKTS